jgi:hypothetical protein
MYCTFSVRLPEEPGRPKAKLYRYNAVLDALPPDGSAVRIEGKGGDSLLFKVEGVVLRVDESGVGWWRIVLRPDVPLEVSEESLAAAGFSPAQ